MLLDDRVFSRKPISFASTSLGRPAGAAMPRDTDQTWLNPCSVNVGETVGIWRRRFAERGIDGLYGRFEWREALSLLLDIRVTDPEMIAVFAPRLEVPKK